MNARILLISALLLILLGCTQEMQSYFAEEANLPRPSLDFSHIGDCATGDCVCMVCKNETPPFPFSLFFESSLEGGSCAWNICGEKEFLDYSKPSTKEALNFFMIGQGSSFAEFNDANPYCNNSLRLAVKWLDSLGYFEYPIPDPNRARCFLDKEAMPLFILYSSGKAVDPNQAGKIAAELNGVGPAIITTEINFNGSNSEVLTNVSNQLIQMKHNCPDCLIALAPKLGDFKSVDAILSNRQLWDSTDIVAFGIDSRDFDTCDPAMLYLTALNFSQYILYTHHKPTLWAYVLIDRGYDNGRCMWTNESATKAYSDLIDYAPAYVDAGVMGASLYSLQGLGPLECDDCGIMKNRTTPIQPYEGAWFYNCQQYYSTRGRLPLVFSDAPGSYCTFGGNYYMYTSALQSTWAVDYPPVLPMETFYRCEACLYTEPVPGMDTGSHSAPPEEYCEVFPEIDYYADLYDIDPALFRSLIWRESGFNPCSVGKSEWYRGMCGGYEAPIDPAEDLTGICPTKDFPPGYAACSWGLTQIFTPPYWYWEETEWNETHDVRRALACGGEEFNPLNPVHNVCSGAALARNKLSAARNFVSNHEAQLGLTAIRGDEELYNAVKNLDVLFFTIIYYKSWNDRWEEAVIDFDLQRTKDDEYCEFDPSDACCKEEGKSKGGYCCGNQYDFPSFAGHCAEIIPGEFEQPPVVYDRYTMYFAMRDKCGYCQEEEWADNLERWIR